MIINQIVMGSGGGTGGLDTSDATAYEENITQGYTAYARGSKLTGSYVDTKNRKTKMLMHMDGVPGSNSFVDEIGRRIWPYGNASISATQSKFGQSAYFDGSGDYLQVSTNCELRFGTIEDFTIDLWAYIISWNDDSNLLIVNNTNGIQIGRQDATSNFGIARKQVAWVLTASSLPSTEVWHHFAITRASGILRIFLDGVVIATSTASNDFNDTGLALVGSSNFNGYIDELRVVRGEAIWTGTFTPPTEPYVESTIDGRGEDQLYYENPIDQIPASPSIYDDEFDDESLSSKWLWVNQGAATYMETQGKAYFSTPPQGDSFRLLTQPAPSGNYTVTAKIRNLTPRNDYSLFGVGIYNSGNGRRNMIGPCSREGVAGEQWLKFSSDTSFAGHAYSVASNIHYLYCRLIVYNNTYTFAVSQDGVVWLIKLNAEPLANWIGGITHIGIGIFRNNTADNANWWGSCDWFRVSIQ